MAAAKHQEPRILYTPWSQPLQPALLHVGDLPSLVALPSPAAAQWSRPQYHRGRRCAVEAAGLRPQRCGDISSPLHLLCSPHSHLCFQLLHPHMEVMALAMVMVMSTAAGAGSFAQETAKSQLQLLHTELVPSATLPVLLEHIQYHLVHQRLGDDHVLHQQLPATPAGQFGASKPGKHCQYMNWEPAKAGCK